MLTYFSKGFSSVYNHFTRVYATRVLVAMWRAFDSRRIRSKHNFCRHWLPWNSGDFKRRLGLVKGALKAPIKALSTADTHYYPNPYEFPTSRPFADATAGLRHVSVYLFCIIYIPWYIHVYALFHLTRHKAEKWPIAIELMGCIYNVTMMRIVSTQYACAPVHVVKKRHFYWFR